MEQVKLLSMTVVLTVLIWATADSLVNEAVSVSVTFDVVPAAGASDTILEAITPHEPYEMQISGPRRLVEDVQGQAPLSIRLRIPDRPTGRDEIHLERRMLKHEMAEQLNEVRKLTIVSVQPDTLPVMVDHWISKDVDIVLNRLALAYEVEPQLKRTSTTVRMRESLFNELPPGQPLQIDIAADFERLVKEQPAGQRATIPVALDSRAFGPGAELRPGTVDVTATVKAQRSTAQIPTVPILVAVSFANLEKPYHAVTRDGTPISLMTQTISVTGPTDEVTRLVRGTTRAIGIIHLKEDDLQQLDVVKLMTPEYRLPEGIVLAEQPPPIEFKLVDKSD